MDIYTLLLIILVFSTYYFAAISNKRLQIYKILLFVVVSLILRTTVPFEISADYNLYTSMSYELSINELFKNFGINIIYQGFFYFTESKILSVHLFFWFNFIISTVFYVWLLKTSIKFYKKIAIFSITYFLFTYILLKNGMAYELVFIFFYLYINKNRTYLSILFAPILFHFSSIVVIFSHLTIYINTKKRVIGLIIGIVILLLFKSDYISSSLFLDKINRYSKHAYNFSLYDFLWLIFLISCFITTIRKTKLNKNLLQVNILLFTAYILAYITNPAPAYRMSLYYLLFYFNLPIIILKGKEESNIFKGLNFIWILIFIFSFIETHYK
ncbi:MAG: hypothetical protein COA67_03665 [Lutibacter sp.]|nr:MAG: hypothetical protein COA67_03665 [Lutibacter sp.]